VGGGVNIAATAVTEASLASGITVDQENLVTQSVTLTSALLENYSRGPETLNDTQIFTDSIPALRAIKLNLSLDIKDVGTFVGGGEVPASVIPTSKIPGAKGTVVGFAGEIGVDYEGGSLDVDFDLASYVGATAGLDAQAESSSFWGLVTGPSSKVHSKTSAGVDFNPWLSIEAEFPDLSIQGEGAVCYAHGGDCSASSLDRELGELSLSVAQAEYIVLDRSGLVSEEAYRVDLSGGAQGNARALNLVNAAGGLVGNGINILSSRDGDWWDEPADAGINALSTPRLDLLQGNYVNQSEGDDEGAVHGGAIVANESKASLTGTASVSLMGGAQAGARALNLVNSADALVGNGINVWDGPVTEASFSDAIEVGQRNEVTQRETLATAGFVDYDRGAESLHSYETEVFSAASPKFLKTDIDLKIYDGDNPEPVGTLTGSIEIPDVLIPTTKIPGVGGTVAGYAGNIDVDLDGGSAVFEFGIADSGLHFNTENSVEGGTGNVGSFILEGNADAALDVDMQVVLDTTLRIEIDMPDLNIETEGAICFAQKGTCSAGVVDREFGELHVDSAEAEYVVLDRSELSVSESHSIALGSEAQSGVRALALVNAAGGLVANGINVASVHSSALSTPTVALVQHNDVLQTAATGDADSEGAVGGVIVANESKVTMTGSTSVTLDGAAQTGARAVSLVNSADALVGNGINIWDGNINEASISSSISMDQRNEVAQAQVLTAARLTNYHRDSETLRDVQTAASTKALSPETNPLYPEAHPKYIRGEVELDIPGVVELTRTGQVPTTIIPTSKVPGGKMTAVGFAGDALVEYDGGSVDLDFGIENHAESNTLATVDGKVSAFFGIASAKGHSSYSENLTVDQSTLLEVDVDMPDLRIEVEGAACYANGGSCEARVLERELGAVQIDSAEAEFIAVDRSSVNSSVNNGVALGGSAQTGARALALVNAAGGLVANGINVSSARSAALSVKALSQAQTNTLVQQVGADVDSEDELTLVRGGSIVANESQASLMASASVSLDGSAQAGARAVSLVNSADALVANGLNVWDANFQEVSFGSPTGIDQGNYLVQEYAKVSSTLSSFQRDAESLRDAHVIADSRTMPKYIKAGFKITVLDPADPSKKLGSYSEGLIVPASAIPTSKVPGSAGVVAGFAGGADVQYGGGTVDVRLQSDSNFHYDNHAHASSSMGDFLGFGSATGTADFGVGLDAGFSPTLVVHADLPELRIQADGGICFAKGGSCDAVVLEREIGALSVERAVAEHVVLDRSQLSTSQNQSISLDNSAQANVRALTIVNAAGGLVSNGVNVSNVRGSVFSGPALNLNQRNVVIQRH
jgi:hypothetical protein